MEHELNKNKVASVSGIINSNYDIGSIVAIVQAVNQNAEVLSELIDRLPKEKTTVHDDTAIEAAYTLKSYCKSRGECYVGNCVFKNSGMRCPFRDNIPINWDIEDLND